MILRIENLLISLWQKVSINGNLRKGVVVFLALFTLAIGINTVLRASRSHGSQYDDFVAFSKDLLYDKVNIYEAYAYDRTTIGKYPPFFGVLLAPLVPLPLWLGAFIWYALGVLLIILAARAIAKMAWHFTGGKGDAPPMVAWVTPLFMALVIIMSNLSTSQINIFIFALVILGLEHFTRRKDHWAGFLIGIAAAIKLTPGLFVVYFAYKGCWKLVLWSALGGLFCWGILLPLLMGPEYYLEVMQSWIGTLDGFVTEGASAEGIVGYRHTNQALEAAFYRYFTHTPADAGIDNFYINLISIPHATAEIIMKVLKVAILLGLGVICRTAIATRKDIRLLFEFSLIFIATLYISPISWMNHFIVMVLPLGAAFYYVMIADKTDAYRSKLLLALLVATLLLNLTHPIFLAFSFGFFGSLYLAVVLIKGIRRPAPKLSLEAD